MALSGRVARVGECLLWAEERTLKGKQLGVFRSVNEREDGNVG
jgi:hypothetical protein